MASDSKIVGETQVLGQLKQAFLSAQETGTTGIVLNQAFRQAVTFAKRMHDVYRINARPMSIGLTSLQMLDKEDLDYENTKIVVIGLGEIGQLVTKLCSTTSLSVYPLGQSHPFQGQPLFNRRSYSGSILGMI